VHRGARSTTFVLGPCCGSKNGAFARIRAHRFREHANANLERHLIEHRLHDQGHAAMTMLPI